MDIRLIWILGVLALAVIAALVISKFKQQSDRTSVIENKLGIAAVPFWSYAVKVAAELLIHEGEEFQEADDLIAQALLEPRLKMPEDCLARLDALMDERYVDDSEYMRPGERDAAVLIKHAIRMARLEAANQVALSGFTVVGRHEPVAQQQGTEPKLI